MPKVTFLHDRMAIEVSVGTSMQDAVAQAKATLPFGCRHGSCGTCRCIIVAGAENLNERTDAERELFNTLTSVEERERLACQLQILGDVQVQS